MRAYFIHRLLQAIPVIAGVALLSFVLTELSGNPIRELLGPRASPETLKRVNEYYGYDPPGTPAGEKFVHSVQRFGKHLWRLAQGDLGASISKHGRSVREMILTGMQVTVRLALGALLVAALLGLTAGILSASRPNSLIDCAASFQATLGVSFPAFFLAMLFLIVFAVKLRLFPIGGYEEGDVRYLVLPCLSLGLLSTASISRLTRNCMLENLTQDYVRTARAKGLGRGRAMLGHALPNALVPIVTVAGADFAGLLTGAVLTETVYGLPGAGSVVYSAIFERDLPVVMGCCIFFAMVFVLVNLLVDICYAALDPRIRYE